MTEHSKFYRSRSDPSRPKITYLLLEAIEAAVKKSSSEAITGDVLSLALSLVHQPKLSDTSLKLLALDLASIYSEVSDKSSQTDERKAAPTLGSELSSWLRNLTPVHICHLLSGFDPNKAEYLYCEVDYRLVIEMVEVFVTEKEKMVQVSYEATMYGFGGKYKGDKGASSVSDDTTVIDLSGNNPEGLSLLGSLGF